jgi:hypothetical protein
MLHQPASTQYVAVRNAQRARTFRVWIHRGSAVAVFDYKAPSGEAAIAQARAELERVEDLLSAI